MSQPPLWLLRSGGYYGRRADLAARDGPQSAFRGRERGVMPHLMTSVPPSRDAAQMVGPRHAHAPTRRLQTSRTQSNARRFRGAARGSGPVARRSATHLTGIPRRQLLNGRRRDEEQAVPGSEQRTRFRQESYKDIDID